MNVTLPAAHLLAQLNPAQQEVVTAPRSNQLVLAGAGSGKTRVLVHRIAWLMQHEQLSPHQLLAVTFTNKAAHQMSTRIEQIVGWSANKMWIGTFHGIAHRLLRIHCQAAGLDENFQIIDSDDQIRLLRRIIKNLELNESKWPVKTVQNFINTQKDEGRRAENLVGANNIYEQKLSEIYREYEQTCNRSHLVDFAELLLRAYELLANHADLLQHYQERFAEILVDEFQDTNAIQYAWLRLLTGENNFITVVGDDDQSIYSWRGAQVSHISRFCEDFTQVSVRRLEQNYRSTETILAGANALIEHNRSRMGKKLWTQGGCGEPIIVYAAFNETEEANYIVEQIRLAVAQGAKRCECAILYRSNALSRVLEEALLQAAIPYRVYGGLRFFERAEIKDALSYLRLIANRHDDAAFERIINQPTRGIGERTLAQLRQHAKDTQCSLWQSTLYHLGEPILAKRAHLALQTFVQLIDGLAYETATYDLGEQTAYIIERSGLPAFYRQQPEEQSQTRLENLAELVSATTQFNPDQSVFGLTPLASFLAHVALEAGEEYRDPDADCVQLMTLHSAKGLEFPFVFLCGLEEGLFPHHFSMQSNQQMEEERRLCYVGMTRAMQKLYLSYAEKRTLYGRDNYHMPSRFLHEIPSELIDEVRFYRTVKPTANNMRTTNTNPQQPRSRQFNFNIGECVLHSMFGEGTIVRFEGNGGNMRVLIHFHEHGEKWLIVAYANLTRS